MAVPGSLVQLDAHGVSKWYEMDYIPYHHLTGTDNSNPDTVVRMMKIIGGRDKIMEMKAVMAGSALWLMSTMQ